MTGHARKGLRLVAAASATWLTTGLAAAAGPAAFAVGAHPSQLDTLRILQRALSPDAGAAGLAAARSQLDQLVRDQTQASATPVEPSWLMARLGALPSSAELAALACVVALAATLAAAFAILIAARRLGGARDAAGAALAAGGTLFDGAARRFTRAQDDALREAEETANQAASRLIAAARDTETRLRTCMGEAEIRIRAAGHLARRDERALSNLPAMLVAALQTEAERGVPALDEAGFRLRDSADFLADRLAEGAGAFVVRVEGAVAAALLHGQTALDEATARLAQENRRAHAPEHDSIATTTSPELPQAIDALAGIVTRLTDERRAQTAELAAALAGAEALASLLPEVTAALATTASGLRNMVTSGSEESETATAGLRAATQACADAVEQLGTCGQQIVTATEVAGAALIAAVTSHANTAGEPFAAMTATVEKLDGIAATMEKQRVNLSTPSSDGETGLSVACIGIEALAARADAILGLVPIMTADLAGVAAQLQARAGVLEEIVVDAYAQRPAQASSQDHDTTASMLGLLTSRMAEGFANGQDAIRQQSNDFTTNLRSALSECATVMRDGAISRTQAVDGVAVSREVVSALASEQAGQTTWLAAKLDTILDVIISLGDAPRNAPFADQEGAVMSALGQIDRALLRVAAASEMQMQASSRAVDAAERVSAACGMHPLSLSRFADLAADVEALRAAADQLATMSLEAEPSAMPPAVMAAAPTLIASIELSIRRLRSTATALAIASDAALAAA